MLSAEKYFTEARCTKTALSLSQGFVLQNFMVKTTARSAVFSPEAECARCFLYRPWEHWVFKATPPPSAVTPLLLTPSRRAGLDHHVPAGLTGGQRMVPALWGTLLLLHSGASPGRQEVRLPAGAAAHLCLKLERI